MSADSLPRAGRSHEVGFYRTDEEFAALIVPFVEEGLAAGEPIILGYDERKTSLLHRWLPDAGAATFITDRSLYSTPARAISAYWKLFEAHTAAGATAIRIAGDVPHEGNGGRFAGWDRYELAANTVWNRFPVASRCLYDARTAPARVLDAAERTHPQIVLPSGGHQPSIRYQDAALFTPLPPDPHPIERSVPAIEMNNPTPRQTRRAITSIGHGRLPGMTLQDLQIGVSEAISNARQHGRPPVTVRIWAATGQLVIQVHDAGPGPADPMAGLVPRHDRPDLVEIGLWIIHMLALDAALIRSRDGFTVRLVAEA